MPEPHFVRRHDIIGDVRRQDILFLSSWAGAKNLLDSSGLSSLRMTEGKGAPQNDRREGRTSEWQKGRTHLRMTKWKGWLFSCHPERERRIYEILRRCCSSEWQEKKCSSEWQKGRAHLRMTRKEMHLRMTEGKGAPQKTINQSNCHSFLQVLVYQ